MREIMDTGQLDELAERLIRSSGEADREYKKFLRKEGSRLKQKVKAQIRASGIRQNTGKYQKSIKRGKVYEGK